MLLSYECYLHNIFFVIQLFIFKAYSRHSRHYEHTHMSQSIYSKTSLKYDNFILKLKLHAVPLQKNMYKNIGIFRISISGEFLILFSTNSMSSKNFYIFNIQNFEKAYKRMVVSFYLCICMYVLIIIFLQYVYYVIQILIKLFDY